MANEALREQLLNYLAYQYETTGIGSINTEEFAEKVGVPLSQVQPVVGMLHTQGLIDTDISVSRATILPKGYELAKPYDISVPKSGGTHVNFNAPVSDSSIAVGYSSAQINNTNSTDGLAEHISALKVAIEQLSVSETQKSESRELITAIESQLSSEKPSLTVVKTLLSSLPTAANIASIGSFILASL